MADLFIATRKDTAIDEKKRKSQLSVTGIPAVQGGGSVRLPSAYLRSDMPNESVFSFI